MSKIWLFMIVSSLFVLVATAPEKALTVMMGASANGVQMCIEFLGIYAIWLGILQVLDDTKLSHKLSQVLRKPIRFVFGQTDPETEKNICLNVSSNILGLGSAATPFGIKAMQGMDKGSEIATKGMIMLVLINSTGIQVLPTTVIGLRALAGSVAPSAIVLPTIISTFVPTIIGIILVKLIYRKGTKPLFDKYKKEKN
jgi:spore maturation protein A